MAKVMAKALCKHAHPSHSVVVQGFKLSDLKYTLYARKSLFYNLSKGVSHIYSATLQPQLKCKSTVKATKFLLSQ